MDILYAKVWKELSEGFVILLIEKIQKAEWKLMLPYYVKWSRWYDPDILPKKNNGWPVLVSINLERKEAKITRLS